LGDKRGGPERLGGALHRYLDAQGLTPRVEQSAVILEWSALVGEQVAAVATPLAITQDGTLFVGVTTHAWMSELSFLERDLLEALNRRVPETPVRRIRFQLARPG
jgi:predicted nucleic acid-binding Zn ribbon protein